MNIPRINLHVHSTYSDGKSSIEKIIKKAISEGLEYIAITDHFTNSWKANIIPTLDTAYKIDKYLDEVETLNLQVKEKNQNLIVLKGIEIDLGSSDGYISSLIKPLDFDIILFEYLETHESISFLKNIISKWKNNVNGKRLPLLGLAHFDPSYFQFSNMDILFSFLSEFNIFFEFNSRYSQYYSTKYTPFFQKMKIREISVSIGSDSHNLSNIGNLKEPLEAIKYFSLQQQLFKLIKVLDERFKNHLR
ncbi:MAG: PHP domain-containing protein [Promethearchaeota archaeon]